MGTTYSRNATEILESDHQDLVSFTGGLLFQSFVNITAKFLSHILADATHIDPNTKQKDGLQSYFFSSLYRRKNTYNYEIDTPPKINIEPENDGLEDDFPFPRVEHLRFHVVIFWGVNWIKVDFRHAT